MTNSVDPDAALFTVCKNICLGVSCIQRVNYSVNLNLSEKSQILSSESNRDI